LSGERAWRKRFRQLLGDSMSVPMILLPVFVQAGLIFALLFAMSRRRGQAGGSKVADVESQLDAPVVLFFVLIALAMPLRHADLVIVMLSWVFVVTRFAHAGFLVTSNDGRTRSLAWLAGALVVLVMWIYFALWILLPGF
jgi:hypothetical protein